LGKGGRFKVVNCRFFNNVCASLGPDVGGAASGLQSIQRPSRLCGEQHLRRAAAMEYRRERRRHQQHRVSWSIYNSLFSHNQAIGNGGNPAESGTLGGGSGGAIYNDGNTMTLACTEHLSKTTKLTAMAPRSSLSPTTIPARCTSRIR